MHIASFELVLDYDHWTYRRHFMAPNPGLRLKCSIDDIMAAILPEAEHDEIPTSFSVVGHVGTKLIITSISILLSF